MAEPRAESSNPATSGGHNSVGASTGLAVEDQLNQMRMEIARLSNKVQVLETLSKNTASASVTPASEVLVLNVGGTKFDTTLETLTKVPGSFFETLLSGRWNPSLDRDGCIFIDREPTVFGYILKYLRDYPRVTINPYALQQSHVALLVEEAKFYQIPTLSRVLEYVSMYRPQNIANLD